MARWLRAATLLVAATSACAWRPQEPALLVPRARRSLGNSTRHIQVHGWHLKLQENRAIRSPYYDECQFYKGHVLNEVQSSATVTECGGQLYGLLQVGGEEFVLQPKGDKAGGEHVLRRRDVFLSEHPVAYNLTGDTVIDLDLDLSDEPPPAPALHVRPRFQHASDTDYYRNVVTISRPAGGVKGLWLEMSIVADYTMLKFHGRERVKHYILALMNIVSAIFNDPSMNSNMTLVINKLYLYEGKDSIIKYGNVKKTLESVNKWNYRHLMKLPEGSAGWDVTAWLTRAPLGGPSGFASVGGVCTKTRSAAIIRDEGLTSAFVIAHELAHLLGLTHDGEDQCPEEAQQVSVMAPTVLAALQNYSWSTCSKKQLHDKAKNLWCLHQRSHDDGLELGGAKDLSNYVFTMNEQCRTEFGEGFSECKLVTGQSSCALLWCVDRAQPNMCRSKRGPPLQGTPCGDKHWCVDGVCQAMPGHGNFHLEVPEFSAPAHWEKWGAWSACGADCGYSLRTRSRRCFLHGAISEACEGAGSQVATCWAGAACPATRDARSDWCRRRNSTYIPHIHPDESKQCEMWCVDNMGGNAMKIGFLPDATPCSYDKPYDLCYQGTCVKGQCNAADTSCNWCPDGYCNNNTHLYNRQLGKGWTRISTIPHEANRLSVHISTPTPLSIAIRERKRDILELSKHAKRFDIEQNQNNYLKYDPNVPQNLQIVQVDSNVIDIKEGYRWEGQVVAAGTLVRWTQTDTDVAISSLSPLQADLMIMATPLHREVLEKSVIVEVSVNYSSPTGNIRPMQYRIERGPCSASCNGGVRLVRPRCTGAKCMPRYEPCNTHRCEFTWAPGEWEYCSATCGEAGVQERQLFCVPNNIDTSTKRLLVRASVSPVQCPNAAPARQQPCNRIPCPVYWKEMPWTPCSTSCGRGVSVRPLVCPAAPALCGPRPPERRRRCRTRRCPRGPPACTDPDILSYCELFPAEQLIRHCRLPRFRNNCCNACKYTDRAPRGTGQ